MRQRKLRLILGHCQAATPRHGANPQRRREVSFGGKFKAAGHAHDTRASCDVRNGIGTTGRYRASPLIKNRIREASPWGRSSVSPSACASKCDRIRTNIGDHQTGEAREFARHMLDDASNYYNELRTRSDAPGRLLGLPKTGPRLEFLFETEPCLEFTLAGLHGPMVDLLGASGAGMQAGREDSLDTDQHEQGPHKADKS
jgi:hypothetical protein